MVKQGKAKKFAVAVFLVVFAVLIAVLVKYFFFTEKVKNPYEGEVKVSPYIWGYEWGPAVTSLRVQLADPVDRIDATNAKIKTNEEERVITKAYLSDGSGNPVENKSRFITIELETTSMETCGNPFLWDEKAALNRWRTEYPVSITKFTFFMNNVLYTLHYKEDCADSYIKPQYEEKFHEQKPFTGTYYNNYTKEDESITMLSTAYEPENIAGGVKNSLLIWLHGGGEGGSDTSLIIYGNELTKFAEDPIQSYFKAGEETGTYVLFVQCPTYWMDEGNGKNGFGSGDSRYTKALMDTINEYVKSNPDIDTDRIYLGGCSNGGYMTVGMMIQYPDYFAAGYPICAPYSYYCYEKNEKGDYVGGDFAYEEDGKTPIRWFTDGVANILKEQPLWFVQAAGDKTVNPSLNGLPVYQTLLRAGAKNCWYSYFENVKGKENPNTTYYEHWSYIYVFQDQVKGVQDTATVLNGNKDNEYGFVPNNSNGGGTKQVKAADGTAYDSLFQWLNAQKKGQ